ncbi:PREDICTED: cornulin-like [Leptosomus discolor]|uniref:cornulin-like n=1 Tax=Leptosomus discolor TaxID=188344 RepID=UPI000522B286|nr:PREDICTED: cornulin-like [Leptosomus discolor]
MAQLQENINGIVAAFYTCARSDGNCSPLSREELRQLVEQEFADAMENPQDPKTIKKVLCFLDDDGNCRVDFSELLSLVFRVAKACYQPLQQHRVLEDGQELTAQERAGGEQLPGPHTAGRVSCSLQVPEQSVNNQVQGTETQDPEGHQTREGETQEQDMDTSQIQEGETPEQDQDAHQTQEGETKEQDQDNHQTQESETVDEDQDTCQDDGAEAPEGDQERGEILDTATPEQDRNTHKAEEPETPKQNLKTHQAQETEAPQQDSNHHQSPETESAEQDLNFPSETPGRDPTNKTQVCEARHQDPNPSKTQKLLPPQQGASPRGDLKRQGTCHDPACHQLPEPKIQRSVGLCYSDTCMLPGGKVDMA